MKITAEFELPDNYAACFCNDKDRIDSLIGSVDKDFTYSIIGSGIEDEANAKLNAAAPNMFYHWVLVAHEQGWQYAFDIINKATGMDYMWGSTSFNELVNEARIATS